MLTDFKKFLGVVVTAFLKASRTWNESTASDKNIPCFQLALRLFGSSVSFYYREALLLT